jgi:hypothetical protein
MTTLQHLRRSILPLAKSSTEVEYLKKLEKVSENI